jgi:hypothetical protein
LLLLLHRVIGVFIGLLLESRGPRTTEFWPSRRRTAVDTDVEIAVGARSSTCAIGAPASSPSPPGRPGTVATVHKVATVNANPGIM